MKASIETTYKVILELTKEESEWLKSYMQNGLPDEHPNTGKMREILFTVLNNLTKE